MQTQTKRFLLGTFGGFVVASILNWFACWFLPERSSMHVLTGDLELEDTYFFKTDDPTVEPSIKGVILKGSKFKVEYKQGDVNYVSFFTVISDDVLKPISEPIGVFEDR